MDLDRNHSKHARHDRSKVECFDCHQLGHYRGDRACPVQVRFIETIVSKAVTAAEERIRALTTPGAPSGALQTSSASSDRVFEEAHE